MNDIIKNTLVSLEKELPTELKEMIIKNFNSVTDSNITKLSDDERVFISLYLIMVANFTQAGGSLEMAATNDIEDVPKEILENFQMCAGYTAQVIKNVLEITETMQIIGLIHA